MLRVRPGVADLTENAAFFRVLLSDTLTWRERLVERFVFGSGNHVRVTSSYQCEIPPDLARNFLPNGRRIDRIKALVPVTSRPKEPVLAFDLRGPDGGPAHLLRRGDIAALQAGYIMEAITTSAAKDALSEGISDELLEAICVFTPGFYDRVLRDQTNPCERHRRVAATSEYLTYGFDFDVTRSDITSWIAQCDRAGAVLHEVLDEPPDNSSSSEYVLLALPLMEHPPATVEAVSTTIERYVSAVTAAKQSADLAVLQGGAARPKRLPSATRKAHTSRCQSRIRALPFVMAITRSPRCRATCCPSVMSRTYARPARACRSIRLRVGEASITRPWRSRSAAPTTFVLLYGSY